MNIIKRAKRSFVGSAVLAVVAIGGFRGPATAATTAPEISSTDSEGSLAEVVVTAQRRAERSQDVPIDVAVLNSAALEAAGPADTTSIVTQVPGLDFSRQASSGGTPFLRGVGTSSVTVGAENSVAVYVDDVYIVAPAANVMRLSDLDRLEVLYGPQGTLFGRNATGGVIQVFTKNPSFDPSGDLSVSYGNFNKWSGSLYATGRLTDTVAANISYEGDHQGTGWGHALASGREIFREEGYTTRAKVLWKPREETRLLVSADISRFNSDVGANFAPAPGTYALTGLPAPPGRFNSWAYGLDSNIVHNIGVSAKLENEFSWATLVSITAWNRVYQQAFLDQDSVPAHIVDIPYYPWTRSFSQELQMRSADGSAIKWIAGAYYLQSIAAYDPLGVGGAAIAPLPAGTYAQTLSQQTVNSISGFAQASYEILPHTNLTLGVRETRDNYAIAGFQYLQFADGSTSAPLAPGQQSSSFSKPTFLGSLDYKFTDDLMVYASYSRGFKSGGYNILSYSSPPVAPEVLDAFQAGFKSEWLNHRVRFNAAGFDYDYKNLQVQFIGTGASYSINAGRARIKGGDAELTVEPVKDLTIVAGISGIDGKYTEFPLGFTYTANDPAVGGNTQILNQDLSGKQTARSPKWTGNLGVNYSIPVPGGTMRAGANWYYNKGFYWDPGNQLKQPSYRLLTASLGWKQANGPWDVSIWGNNLLNDFYYSFATLSTFGTQVSPAEPRTYGVTVRFHF
jgi:iron complex outermembrane receptor protein